MLFCTTAFGMGVDVRDIRTVIHFGPASDIDDYFQESVRAGVQSNAVLYLYPGSLFGHVSKGMKKYSKVENECRRKFLLSNFISDATRNSVQESIGHTCYDICAQTCSCDEHCPGVSQIAMTPLTVLCEDIVPKERVVTQDQQLTLRVQLQAFYDMVLTSAREQYPFTVNYMVIELACGLQDNFVDCVLENCKYIYTVEDLEEKCLVWKHSSEIFRIIDECICDD